MNSVGYFYNLHVNLYSFLYCITTVKKFSPESPIQLFTDVHSPMYQEYAVLSSILKLPITVRDVDCSFIDKSTSFESNLVKMQEYVNRMYTACKAMDVKWVVRLEDDVHMRRPISRFPETTAAGNHGDFGMGGGSIFDREVFVSLYEQMGPAYIESKCKSQKDYAWAGDGLLRYFFTDNGYTYSKWSEITEDWYDADKDAAFHHGDKSLYNKEYLQFRGIIK